MTDSTPVRRFNWNEEIREYEDADGDECTYKTVVPASDFDRLQAENVRLTKECERLTKSADWYCRYANDKDKSVTEEMARANIAEKERDSLRAQLAQQQARERSYIESTDALLEQSIVKSDETAKALAASQSAQVSMYVEGKRFEGLWRESAQQLVAALAKVEEAQRDAERWRWYRNHRVTHGSVLEEDIDSAMTAKEGK